MKKALFLLLSSTLLHAVDISLSSDDSEPSIARPNLSTREKVTHGYTFRPLENSGSFNYLSLGALTHPTAPDPLQSTLPGLTFGKRWLDGSLGWDSSFGLRFGEYSQLAYLQSSYLLYPFQPNKLYLGLGLEGGALRNSPNGTPAKLSFHYDMPLTLGYQFAGSERRNFFQVQAYPKAYASDKDLTFAASYGFGF